MVLFCIIALHIIFIYFITRRLLDTVMLLAILTMQHGACRRLIIDCRTGNLDNTYIHYKNCKDVHVTLQFEIYSSCIFIFLVSLYIYLFVKLSMCKFASVCVCLW